jgi:hypothetical protein
MRIFVSRGVFDDDECDYSTEGEPYILYITTEPLGLNLYNLYSCHFVNVDV